MEESKSKEELCWRKEVDQNLKRLHSLLFGSELCLEKGDSAAAQVLALQLLGFLDSRSQSEVDETFIRPIRRDADSKLHAARRASVQESDRRAFEQAGKAPGSVFSKEVNIDIEKIKKSKYFQVLLQQYNGGALNDLGEQPSRQGKLISKPSKVMAPAKLASLYGNKISSANSSCKTFATFKTRSSEDCSIVEKPHFYNNPPKGNGISAFSRTDEEDRGHVNTLGAKRGHNEIRSPRQDSARSSITEEANADVSGNGFVTAKAKLVHLLPMKAFLFDISWQLYSGLGLFHLISFLLILALFSYNCM